MMVYQLGQGKGHETLKLGLSYNYFHLKAELANDC